MKIEFVERKLRVTKDSSIAEYEQIRKYMIDSVLVSGKVPTRIASMRELAAMFDVSTATIQRALKELVDDDFLTVKPGVGLFTNPERAWLREKTEVIGVLVADGRQIYFEEYLWNLLAAVGKRITGSKRLLYSVNLLYSPVKALKSAELASMSGLVWIGPDFAPSVAAEKFFETLQLPAITINDCRAGFSCIARDEEQEGYEIGQKLIAEKRVDPVVIIKNKEQRQLIGLRRAFSEAGLPFNEKLLLLRSSTLEERLGTVFDLIGPPCAIYAIGGSLREIEHVIREREVDFDHCRIIGESFVWPEDFSGWVLQQEYEALAEAACTQLFHEIDGGKRKEHRIPRIIQPQQGQCGMPPAAGGGASPPPPDLPQTGKVPVP